MPAQYRIERKPSGYADVYYAQLFTQDEILKRFRDLLKNGWTEYEARLETANIPKSFTRCNTDAEGYLPKMCYHFIVTYAQPGDIITDGEAVYIVGRQIKE